MKKTIFGITLALLLLSGNALAQTQANDEMAINAVLMKAGQAWESGDMTKFAETLTENCIHIDPFGKVLSGREAIRKTLQWVRDEIYKKEKVELEVNETTLRFLNADTAIVVMKMRETGKGDPAGVSLTETFTVSRVKNEWKISSFQGIEAKEPPKVAGK